MTKISVVTAVYNARNTVAGAIESVLGQRYGDVESVVVDGGSTDGTVNLLEPYRPRLGVFVSERDRGIYDALNKGIALSGGDVIGFMHADDQFEDSDVLTKVAAAFEDPAVDAVYGDLVYVDAADSSRVIRHWASKSFQSHLLRQGWMPPHPTLYVRRAVYDRIGGFDIRYRIAADYDSVVKMFGVAGIKSVHIPSVMVRMRVGGVSNRSFKTIVRKSREDLEIMRTNRIGGVGVLLRKNFGKISQFL